MKTLTLDIKAGGQTARSALECGGTRGATPLSPAPWLTNGSEPSPARLLHRRCALPEQSKKTWRLAVVCFCFLLSAFCFRAAGQSYSIDWYKVSGGGGTSTGATYQVTGTIGQHDAGGPMTGGSYSLTGGFWSLIAVVQTLGAPPLTIIHSGNAVKVLWPYPSTGWTLQQNSDLTMAANWSASGGIANDGVNNFITLTSPAGNLFFRLQHP